MNNHKYQRLAQDIKEKINTIINEEFDDLDFVTVTHVDITKDLGDAIIYVNCIQENSKDFVLDYLNRKSGYLKRHISSIKMRRVPNLIFKYDDSLANYNKIDDLLKK